MSMPEPMKADRAPGEISQQLDMMDGNIDRLVAALGDLGITISPVSAGIGDSPPSAPGIDEALITSVGIRLQAFNRRIETQTEYAREMARCVKL